MSLISTQKRELVYKKSVINYYVYGHGKEALFCLHGYGESGTSFRFLEKYLENNFTVYAIDLPFHGGTQWNEKKVLDANDLLTVFQRISSNKIKKYCLLAYSLGGRVAMHLIKKFPEKFKRVILVAPAGLHVNFWFRATTQTAMGHKLFAVTMNHPHWFFATVNAARKFSLITKDTADFIHLYLDDKEERKLLYKRWTVLRKFKPDHAAIKKVCANHNIQLYIVFGKFDKIIKSHHADAFKHSKNIFIKIIEADHHLLKDKYAPDIAALLYE